MILIDSPQEKNGIFHIHAGSPIWLVRRRQFSARILAIMVGDRTISHKPRLCPPEQTHIVSEEARKWTVPAKEHENPAND
jgi:hypothetical protein